MQTKVPTVYGEVIEQLRARERDDLCQTAATVIEKLEFRALGYAGRIANLAEKLDSFESALKKIARPGDSVRARSIAKRALDPGQP